MVQLITNRSQHHVDLLKRLCQKPWANMTASERAIWYGEAAKGSYNHTDLNRVETAVAELAGYFGLNLTTKTDWSLWDIPTQTDMNRYLNNVIAIRDATPGDSKFPTLPDSMSYLTYEGANNIEKVLEIAYQNVVGTGSVLGKGILGEMVLGKES